MAFAVVCRAWYRVIPLHGRIADMLVDVKVRKIITLEHGSVSDLLVEGTRGFVYSLKPQEVNLS